jgi:RNA polymerase sigma-70 factor (ECF subfamily)
MTTAPPETEHLLAQARQGNDQARQLLLARHRSRLRRMVSVHLDRRLIARVDPSDVVQEALAEAAHRLDDYLQQQPLPFYAWLRRLAWERLVKLQRHHQRQRRSVRKEEPGFLDLPDESAILLAQRLIASGTSDREVLVLRYLEGLSTKKIAAVLGVSEGAVKMRHLRALEGLRRLLDDNEGEESEP